MSIYSGFATRKSEAKYNQCLESLLHLLQSQVLSIFNKTDAADPATNEANKDRSFKVKFSKVFSLMRSMEDQKYLPPKFSETVRPLADLIGVDRDHFEQYIPLSLAKSFTKSGEKLFPTRTPISSLQKTPVSKKKNLSRSNSNSHNSPNTEQARPFTTESVISPTTVPFKSRYIYSTPSSLQRNRISSLQKEPFMQSILPSTNRIPLNSLINPPEEYLNARTPSKRISSNILSGYLEKPHENNTSTRANQGYTTNNQSDTTSIISISDYMVAHSVKNSPKTTQSEYSEKVEISPRDSTNQTIQQQPQSLNQHNNKEKGEQGKELTLPLVSNHTEHNKQGEESSCSQSGIQESERSSIYADSLIASNENSSVKVKKRTRQASGIRITGNSSNRKYKPSKESPSVAQDHEGSTAFAFNRDIDMLSERTKFNIHSYGIFLQTSKQNESTPPKNNPEYSGISNAILYKETESIGSSTNRTVSSAIQKQRNAGLIVAGLLQNEDAKKMPIQTVESEQL